MKICLITTSFPAYKGHLQSPFVYNLAKALAKKHQVDVICPYYQNSEAKEEILDSINVHRVQYFYPKSLQILTSKGGVASQLKKSFIAKLQLPIFSLALLFKSFKYARRCDVIHAQWTLTALISLFFRKPLILTTRGADITMSLKSKILKKVLVFTLNRCNHITTICQDFKDKMVELGIPSHKITRISNGLDPLFKPRDKQKIRNWLGLPDKKIILFVGWLIERKGVEYLVKAVPEIIKKHKDILVLIIGEGILYEKLKKLISSLKIQKYVKLLGSKEPRTIPYWMNASDIFILPTLSDGRPNTVIEAIASGIPVITTNVPGPSEVVDKKTGILINPKSSEDIVKAVNKLLIHLLIPKISKGNTWDECANKYIKIYKRCLE